MARTITLIIIFSFYLNVYTGFSQSSVKVSLIEKSSKPNYAKEHLYKIEVENRTANATSYEINVDNSYCKNKNRSNDITYNLYDTDLNLIDHRISLAAKQSRQFYIKLIKSNRSTLNSWNCTRIEVNTAKTRLLSNKSNSQANSVTIKSFIPDPNNDN
ncbi:hypothetical protein [uncultured Tenacibaculum sp.]|uniref:hypothetical protein n=1 Tax=uncultured Tenacibaculum sp. TaxID=174713 RepID=UPI00260ED6FD|nr:hypothetical protein [uncultured Tenacibaculum sp.]